MEPVYSSVITTARLLWLAEGLKFKVTGVEHVPDDGPGVVAFNHTGYLDFTYAGIPAYLKKRYVRFMAKKEVFDNAFGGPIMRALKHIPVDREQGGDSYRLAVDYLKRGELVGVYPEATISRSFELKAFKSGAARMSLEANAPIIPTVIWGAQQVWTKGHPKSLGRHNYKIMVGVAEPLEPIGNADALTAKLHDVMSKKLLELQDSYEALYGPHPQGAFWVPARLGGSAPTLEEANEMDAKEQAERAARRAAREAGENPSA